jgi:hypothetical protein
MGVGTKRRIVEKEPTRANLNAFFTVVKKEDRKSVGGCSGDAQAVSSGFEDHFQPFCLKSNAKLAPLFRKLHYKTPEPTAPQDVIMDASSPSGVVIPWKKRPSCQHRRLSWRQTGKTQQEALLMHLKRVQLQETCLVPFKLLQFHDNYRPAYYGA